MKDQITMLRWMWKVKTYLHSLKPMQKLPLGRRLLGRQNIAQKVETPDDIMIGNLQV